MFEPDAIEKAFSEFEDMAARVIRQIIRTEQLPSGKDRNVLINFIALMVSRTPSMINHHMEHIIELNKMLLGYCFSSKEYWNSLIYRLVDEGELSPKDANDTDYEKMHDFFYSGNYKMDINQNYKVKQILDSVDILIPLLARRKWSLFISKDITTTIPQLGGFICSDNPVSLVSVDPLPSFYSPGFGMSCTEVTIPLSKSIALVGRFEGKSTTGIVSIKGLAAINSRTGMYVDRFLYHSNKNFIFFNEQQQLCNVNYLVERCSSNKGLSL